MGFRQDIADSRAPALAFIAMGMVWGAFSALVPVIKAQIFASDAAFGLSFLISSLGAIAAMWLAPMVDRRFGTWAVMLTSLAMGLSFVLPALTSGIILFTLFMGLVGATSGVLDILMNARISEIESRTNRPLMNLNHALFSFAYAGAALLTGAAREVELGPVAVFGLVALAIAAMCPLMICERHHPVQGEMSKGGLSTRVLVWLGGLVVMAAFFSEQAVEGWSALHLERTLDAGAAAGAMGPAILGLTMGFGRLFGQALALRFRDTVMMGVACLISAAGITLAALAPNIPMAYLGFAIMGGGISVVVPLAMALVGRAVHESQRVAAIGQASVIGYGAFLFGPSVIGLTSDQFGLPVALMVVGLVLIFVALIIVPMIARRLALA